MDGAGFGGFGVGGRGVGGRLVAVGVGNEVDVNVGTGVSVGIMSGVSVGRGVRVGVSVGTAWAIKRSVVRHANNPRKTNTAITPCRRSLSHISHTFSFISYVQHHNSAE